MIYSLSGRHQTTFRNLYLNKLIQQCLSFSVDFSAANIAFHFWDRTLVNVTFLETS